MTAPRRILVTGAGGFVGRHLMKILRAEFPGALLIGAERTAGGALPLGADETLPFDLLVMEALDELVARAKPDAVLHLAAQASVAASFRDPALSWRANLMGTLALAEAVLRRAPDARFLFASSAEVYGLSFLDGRPLAEDAMLSPANPYAAAKAAADLALGEMALRGLRAVRLRPFNHVGPGQSQAFVVASFAAQLARIVRNEQEPVMRVGALDRWRDFLDVRDVCHAYALALRTEFSPGTVFNLASGVARQVGDVLAELIARSGVRPRVETDPRLVRPTDVERVVGDPARARAQLGWEPRIPWERTMDDIMAAAVGRAALA